MAELPPSKPVSLEPPHPVPELPSKSSRESTPHPLKFMDGIFEAMAQKDLSNLHISLRQFLIFVSVASVLVIGANQFDVIAKAARSVIQQLNASIPTLVSATESTSLPTATPTRLASTPTHTVTPPPETATPPDSTPTILPIATTEFSFLMTEAHSSNLVFPNGFICLDGQNTVAVRQPKLQNSLELNVIDGIKACIHKSDRDHKWHVINIPTGDIPGKIIKITFTNNPQEPGVMLTTDEGKYYFLSDWELLDQAEDIPEAHREWAKQARTATENNDLWFIQGDKGLTAFDHPQPTELPPAP